MAGWDDGAVYRQMAAMFGGLVSLQGYAVDLDAAGPVEQRAPPRATKRNARHGAGRSDQQVEAEEAIRPPAPRGWR